MQASTRFTVAVHILLCVDICDGEHGMTSDLLARSIGTNPVFVRNLLGHLKKAGLIETTRGCKSGITIPRPLSEITFYDIYRAVESPEDESVFQFHDNLNMECPIAKGIHSVLDYRIRSIDEAFMEILRGYNMKDVADDMRAEMH